MNKDSINQKELKILKEEPSEETNIKVDDNVFIIVTQAFCPNGHNLVGMGEHKFDGYDGICIKVSDGQKEGIVELSPFHGDHTKFGPEFPDGTKLKLTCPECGAELPHFHSCTCETGDLHKIYLSSTLKDAYIIALCDVWGCHMSRVIDNNELFSEFSEN